MFFDEYIGKTVSDPNYARTYTYGEHLNSRPYDEDADGEEANWTVSTTLLITVEKGKIEALEPDVRVYCPGDSGLGDVDPYDYWEKEDDDAAQAILGRITK